ncbi:hypothetical protein ZWY2020_035349 [Hordeum vulgare]|nr:hypothetical protein ZWY2020_035349 [Hordeum vulgare]
MDSSGHPPGSALAQRLRGSPLPLIQCDDCTQMVVPLTSAMPKHPGWVFFKCENDVEDGCSFWFWEDEYIDSLIERKLIDVDALLSRIKNNDAAACATSTFFESKMKNEKCNIKNPQINNECMEKILLQLVGAVMEVGNLLKCIFVVLIFFGLAILAKM